MAEHATDLLNQFSDAVAARTAAAAPLVVGIDAGRGRWRSAVLWRGDVVIASEQVLPKLDEAELHFSDGQRVKARLAGRDPGTNIAAFRLPSPLSATLPQPGEPKLGSLVLALSADGRGGAAIRFGIVRSLGPAWHSRAGGRIDSRIALDLTLARNAEGGPVIDAAGRRLGMSTAGPGGRAIVIPAATIERVLEPLLAHGRIDRGWLGVALQQVALPEGVAAGQGRGLMVMRIAPDSPAAAAGVIVGDILVAVDGAVTAHPGAIARRFGPESIGKPVELRLIRTGAPQVLTATVTARPAA